MAGRKPKPTNLKILHGNPGGRRLPKNEPKPELGIPDPPSWIEPGSERRRVWDEYAAKLLSMGVLTFVDGMALAALVDAHCDWREAAEIVQREGLTCIKTTDRGGSAEVARPEIAIRNDAWKRMKSMQVEFGLTPSARSRVSASPRDKASPLSEFLKNG